MQTIGFIGTGIMGQGMVRNLMKAGYPVQIYSRTRSKAQALEEEGAVWCDSPARCAAGAQVVITMVGYPRDVEEVYFAPGGLLESAAPGTCLIDMTTTSPRLAQRIYDAGKARGLDVLDAPVSGGSTGAAEGTLAIMAGGQEDVFRRCLPVLEAMGSNIVLEGGPGAGQHTKMANQIAVAGAVAGVAEAIAYAQRAGLDPERVFNTIRTGAAGSVQMEGLAPKMIAEDFTPSFYLRHFVKDLTIAREEALDRSLHLGVMEEVLRRYRLLEDEGLGGQGTAALIRSYQEEE